MNYSIFIGQTRNGQQFSELKEEIAEEVIKIGLCPELRSAYAVTEKRIERGFALVFHDEEEAMRAAFWLKPGLRLGAYGIKLNEYVKENKIFRTHFVYDQDFPLEKRAAQWLDMVEAAVAEGGEFVTAFLYDSPKGVAVAGSAHSEAVNMDKWEQTIISIIRDGDGIGYPMFN